MTDDTAVATKADVQELQKQLKAFATKDDLKDFATKDDLKDFATKEELKAFATKEDLKAFATKEDIQQLEQRVSSFEETIIRHFDVAVEQIRHDMLGMHSDKIEVLKDTSLDHEKRITTIENRLHLAA